MKAGNPVPDSSAPGARRNFHNGLLSIALEREVPEAMKPRKIEIGAGGAQRQLQSVESEQRKAA